MKCNKALPIMAVVAVLSLAAASSLIYKQKHMGGYVLRTNLTYSYMYD